MRLLACALSLALAACAIPLSRETTLHLRPEGSARWRSGQTAPRWTAGLRLYLTRSPR